MLHESYSARRELEYASDCPYFAYVFGSPCVDRETIKCARANKDLANSCLVLSMCSMPSSILGLYAPCSEVRDGVYVCSYKGFTAGNSCAHLVVLSGMATPSEGKRFTTIAVLYVIIIVCCTYRIRRIHQLQACRQQRFRGEVGTTLQAK